MKRIFLFLVAGIILAGCKKTDVPASVAVTQEIKRSCGTVEALKAQLLVDPGLQERMNRVEDFTRKALATGVAERMKGTTIQVPVVVHILYHTPQENISDAQVQSQIDVLNEDFNLRNSDRNLVPTIFKQLRGDIGLNFTLVQTIRKYCNQKEWQPNDNMKFSSRGGSDAVDAAHYLNIWVCNLGQNLLGYAYYPGISADRDGVVTLYSAFGRTGTLIPHYDLGRTATHEIGHWANLIHIWGDATCGDDLVADTPTATTANFGCPGFPLYNDCGDHAIEMTMNYMDYTDDACMYMFSNGQGSRMLSVFAPGGPRASFVN